MPRPALTVYGIRNCDTIKRARQALDEAGIAHHFHDFKVDGLDAALAKRWIDVLGADVVVNRRGTSWRKLGADSQARVNSDPASLLADQPSLVKRPVWDCNGELRIGFARGDAEKIIAWAAGAARSDT